MSKFLNGLKEKNLLKLVSGVLDIIHLCIKKEKIELLLESYYILGLIYKQFRKETEAMNLLVKLDAVANYRLDFSLKLKLAVEIGELLSRMGHHEQAIRMYKKGLAYSWYLNNNE